MTMTEMEKEFFIDVIDEMGCECTAHISIEYDDEEGEWFVTESDIDSSYGCSLVDEYYIGAPISESEIEELEQLEGVGIDECDHDFFDARAFEAMPGVEDEAFCINYIEGEKSSTFSFEVRMDIDGNWRVICSDEHSNFPRASEFSKGAVLTKEQYKEIDNIDNNDIVLYF